MTAIARSKTESKTESEMLRCGVLMFLFLIMPQTKAGAIKVLSKKLGISVEEFTQKVSSGLKNCFRCKEWLSLELFRSDKSRYDGKDPSCKKCSKAYANSRRKLIPIELRKPLGPPPSPPRDGDKRQARARVNHYVEAGRLPHPNTLACVDCGHLASDKRHEYDHHKGYDGINHLEIECVCTSCHAKREKQRRDSKK